MSSRPQEIHDPLARQNFEFCKRIALGHYENFPVGSLLLPGPLRPYIYALYAFMRTADDFADLTWRTTDERVSALRDWRTHLDECLEGRPPMHPVFAALQVTIRRFNLDPTLFYRLLEAFEFDAPGNVQIQDLNQLRWYTHRSAEPVGELVLAIFGYTDRQRIEKSNAICTGLQLLNFLQDVEEDLSQRRSYLPAADAEALGVDLSANKHLSRLVLFETERAAELLNEGAELPEMVTGRLRYELRAVLFGAARMLEKIRSLEGNVLGNRPKLNPYEHLFILGRALLGPARIHTSR